jgi:hypothetical protein
MQLAAAPYRASGLVHWRKADSRRKVDVTKQEQNRAVAIRGTNLTSKKEPST